MANLVVQTQDENEWCWAAVAVSIHQFLNPTASLAWTQKTLATKVLQQERQISPGIDCSLHPDKCNFPAKLDDALDIVGNLDDGVDGTLTFEDLKKWIDAKLPVCARICWYGGGAHFVVLDGYLEFSSGERQVHVQDPLGHQTYQYFEDLLEAYPPGGSWQNTILVQK